MKSGAKKILAAGELLFDCFPGFRRPGGAPANFVIGVSAFDAEAKLLSAVGRDADGDELLELFRSFGGDTELIRRSGRPTGRVEVKLENAVPVYDIRENSAWDDLCCDDRALAFAGEADAVVFGSLAARAPASREAISRAVAAAPESSWKIFDINLRQHYYTSELLDRFLGAANVLKISEEELPAAAECLSLPSAPDRFAREAMEKYRLKLLLLSRGKEGSRLYDGCGSCDAPAAEIPGGGKPVSTVGAGDAFLAGFTGALLSGADADAAQTVGNRFAAFVCACEGAWARIPHELTIF